jgi:hypothetical protein
MAAVKPAEHWRSGMTTAVEDWRRLSVISNDLYSVEISDTTVITCSSNLCV